MYCHVQYCNILILIRNNDNFMCALSNIVSLIPLSGFSRMPRIRLQSSEDSIAKYQQGLTYFLMYCFILVVLEDFSFFFVGGPFTSNSLPQIHFFFAIGCSAPHDIQFCLKIHMVNVNSNFFPEVILKQKCNLVN